MPKIFLQGFLEIPEAQLSHVIGALPKHRGLTLSEPGCLVFGVEPDETHHCRYNVYEEFVSQEAFEYHQKRAKESEWGRVTINVERHYQVHVLS